MRGLGTALGAGDGVVLARQPNAAACRRPHLAHDRDRLFQRGDALAGGQARAGVGRDGFQEATGAKAELHPAAGDQVQRGDAAGEDDGMTQREVGDVGGDLHALGLRGDDGQQSPGVHQARLVRVVLETDEVEADLLGQLCQRDHAGGVVDRGGQERAEDQLVAVVHGSPSPVGGSLASKTTSLNK